MERPGNSLELQKLSSEAKLVLAGLVLAFAGLSATLTGAIRYGNEKSDARAKKDQIVLQVDEAFPQLTSDDKNRIIQSRSDEFHVEDNLDPLLVAVGIITFASGVAVVHMPQVRYQIL